jgi:hypothetical protein
LLEAIKQQKTHKNRRQFSLAFTTQQANQLCFLLKNLLVDENNMTAIKRYRDLNTILEHFDQGGKENFPV